MFCPESSHPDIERLKKEFSISNVIRLFLTIEYYNRYVRKYAIAPGYHGAKAYSALLVAADALRRAESFGPGSIRAAMDDTNLLTPFGPVKFSSYAEFERQNSLPTQVLQIIEGKFQCVWPEELATARFIPLPKWRVSE